MATNSIGQINLDLTLNKKKFDKDVNRTLKNTESAFNQSFTKIGTVIATAFSTAVITKFGKSAVNAASEAQAAWTGLNSIVKGTGNSFGVAHDFLTKFTKDGLVGIEDAATAYKNLLSRGYDTTQIENVMTRLKDSAAFGRQSSYTLSQAVVSATEGLKNENSILVDNAGVTKNVAKMWDEYAASIGTTANNLTQQQKIQAEVNGIMKETTFQAGDAATYTNTFAGKVSVLKGAFSSMKIAIGKVVAPIVGLFIPAITSAINAITLFFNKLQGILSIFGLEFPDVVQKTSTGISNIGDSAISAAGNIASTGDAATKAAKKINKAFAGVDEINVLNTKNDSSSGSIGLGDSSGIGGNSGSAVNTGNDAISSAIQSTSDKIMKFIKPLQDISFDKLVSAFNRLKDAIAPIGKTLFAGLEWAYFNILVPLAKWTIEDLLPAFLDLLSGALKVLNPILISFGNVFEPIWNNLLKPLLSWTGGVIVDVIEGVAKALSKVGDWMSDNQGVVDTIVASLATFFGLWKLTELAAFIQLSGGIVTAFNLITGSIISNTAATWLFNTALAVLTSPITLVVAAIAALVAGIVLLIKNWDKVKETALNCWAEIQEAWSNTKNWINTNVVQPIANVFSTLVTKGSEIGTNLINGICDSLTKAKDKVVKKWDEVKGWFSNITKEAKVQIKQKWADIKGKWQSLMSNFQDKTITIKTKIGEVIGNIKSTINDKVIKPINNKLPSIFPKIPYLAQGGWFDKNNPTLAVVGDNKHEPEITAPESKIYEQTKKAVEDAGGTNKQQIEIVLNVKYEDGKSIIKKINNTQIQDGKITLLV